MPKQDIIRSFPKLNSDPLFRLSSHQNVNYNCIAWAGQIDYEFWWPEIKPYNLDGVKYNWPFNIKNSDKLEYFIELFSHLGYKEESDNISNEHPKYRKIALYVKDDPFVKNRLYFECTHAARQLKNGLWASKLGIHEDIEHSNPYDLEGNCYGKIAIILKKNLL